MTLKKPLLLDGRLFTLPRRATPVAAEPIRNLFVHIHSVDALREIVFCHSTPQ